MRENKREGERELGSSEAMCQSAVSTLKHSIVLSLWMMNKDYVLLMF